MLQEVFFSHVISQIFWFFLIFALLCVLIRDPLARLREIVEERHVHITERFQQARTLRKEADILRARYQKEIRSLRRKLRQEMAIMKSQIRNEGREVLLEEDRKLFFLLQEMRNAIQQKCHNATNSLEQPAIILAQELAKSCSLPYDRLRLKNILVEQLQDQSISASFER